MEGLVLTTDEGEQTLAGDRHLGGCLLAQIAVLGLGFELPPERGWGGREAGTGGPVEKEHVGR